MGGTDNFFGASKHDKSVPNNNAVKSFANAARLQALPLRSTGILQVGGQWANRALLPSEKNVRWWYDKQLEDMKKAPLCQTMV